MELMMFIGIQAVGKSTFYQQHFFNTHIRINLDMLKTRHREQIVVNACLAAQQPFVIDNTNVTREARAHYIALAKTAQFRVIGYYFQSTIRDALERNRRRSGAQVIPERGIAGTHKRLQLPQFDEGFDELYYVSINNGHDFVIQEWNDEI